MDVEQLKYPIGKVDKESYLFENVSQHIQEIENFPALVIDEISSLSRRDLGFKYRPDGWTIKQVVNHCLDSHMNAVIRFKLTLTEHNPTIKPYEEQLWAMLDDTLEYEISQTLSQLGLMHKRWVFLLKSLSEKQLMRTFKHPAEETVTRLYQNIGIYAWHCRHHLAHIKQAKELRFL